MKPQDTMNNTHSDLESAPLLPQYSSEDEKQARQPALYDAAGRPLYLYPYLQSPGHATSSPATPAVTRCTGHCSEQSTKCRRNRGGCCRFLCKLIFFVIFVKIVTAIMFGCYYTHNNFSAVPTYTVRTGNTAWPNINAMEVEFTKGMETHLNFVTTDSDSTNTDNVKMSYSLAYTRETLDGDLDIDTIVVNNALRLVVNPPKIPHEEKLRLTVDITLPAILADDVISQYQKSILAKVAAGHVYMHTPTGFTRSEKLMSTNKAVFNNIGIHVGAGNVKINDVIVIAGSVHIGSGNLDANLIASEQMDVEVGAGSVELHLDTSISTLLNKKHTPVQLQGPAVNIQVGSGNVQGDVTNYNSLYVSVAAGEISLGISPEQGSSTIASTKAGEVNLRVVDMPTSRVHKFVGKFTAESSIGSVSVKGKDVTVDHEKTGFFGVVRAGHVGSPDAANPSMIEASTNVGSVSLKF
ncbi:expressed protein [Batrachochytrium dendrobatidis JAM81]|uniref:Expressed protein n=2 Tax=Batrachochytrium dendrobatidis TaxID=109871 RepID=F4P090_BATDJ|nr:uncharacterized protein BATDEDRAFT_36786 [Batrachochytrium dendrobatidis JAM81]EGF81407.1 expressed protein [Batrachochytrium dendrobatidis JAM81]OAJ38559.1 hypothetical protein BDEG_22467 [Batrachochytrium dendrobatidis JEL423]|eukprot:XP_006678048.1 expressed protein [Batrachochytrium dendrobatidis JAM81]